MSHRNKQDCKFPSFILVLLILFKTVLPFHANSTNLVNASKVQFIDDELPLLANFAHFGSNDNFRLFLL